MNVLARPEFELAYNNVTAEHISYYTTDTLPYIYIYIDSEKAIRKTDGERKESIERDSSLDKLTDLFDIIFSIHAFR